MFRKECKVLQLQKCLFMDQLICFWPFDHLGQVYKLCYIMYYSGIFHLLLHTISRNWYSSGEVNWRYFRFVTVHFDFSEWKTSLFVPVFLVHGKKWIIQSFAKGWHILCVLKTWKMCQSLVNHCILITNQGRCFSVVQSSNILNPYRCFGVISFCLHWIAFEKQL